MNNENKVPKMISGKDLDYLSDIFSWNYGAYKTCVSSISHIKDDEIIKIFNKASNVFMCNIEDVLNILKGGTCE